MVMKMTRTFNYFFTGTAAIRRPGPILSGGKRGTAPTSDVTILCTPMAVVTDDEVRRQIRSQGLDAPFEARQIFAGSTAPITVRKGDHFVLGGRIFPIRATEEWPMFPTGEHMIRLILEVVDK